MPIFLFYNVSSEFCPTDLDFLVKYVRTYVARYYEHNPKQIHVQIQEQIKWTTFNFFSFFFFLLQKKIHALLTIQTIFYFHSGAS